MVLPDSASEKWILREHTRVKLELLEKYLRGWVKILGKWHRRVLYLDGFAGRGQYEEGEKKVVDGSPIRAMRVGQSFKNYVAEFIAVFVESNLDNYVNLHKVVASEKTNCPNVITEVVHGEFALVVADILDDLDRKGAKMAPSFFFIDPFGFGGVPFTLIRRIFSRPRTEVFFTFMSRDMNRFLSSPSHQVALRQLFETEEWIKLLHLPEEARQEALVALYRTQLMKEAGVKFVWPFRVSHTEKREVIYHLLHASNHFKALMLMKGIMYNQGAEGAFTYFGPDEAHFGRDQARLGPFDLGPIKKLLVEKFGGKELAFEDIMQETWDTPYVEKNYRQAIHELQEEGRVVVRPVSSKTAEGLKERDLVLFRG